MLRISREPPIGKSGDKVKNLVDKIILTESVLVFHDPKNFDSSNGGLYLHVCPGYFYIIRLQNL